MNIELKRIALRETYTIGHLYIDGEKFSDSLEDKVRPMADNNGDGDLTDPGEGKVWGKTAILPGRYKVVMQYSPAFKRRMPYVLGVLGFVGVMIHGGVDENSTLGCICIGENNVIGKLQNSRGYSDRLNEMLIAAEKRGEKSFITIT